MLAVPRLVLELMLRFSRWQDPNLAERLRMEVPPFFVFAAVSLFALTIIAVGVHASLGNFASYEGISLLQEDLVVRSSLALVPSTTRSMRLQGLAEGADDNAGGDADVDESADEDEDEVIRFENDKKVGGGDLMVPISMVDYENLGEGSIVDQVRHMLSPVMFASRESRHQCMCPLTGLQACCSPHELGKKPDGVGACRTNQDMNEADACAQRAREQRYPRKLPGSDELEAEWNALWNWDWGSDDSATGGGGGDDKAKAADQAPPAQKQAAKPVPKENSKLEDMGVNVNGYHKSGTK